MLTAIRKRLTYTNVAMTVALVFAMSGGAYAANKYLITSTKQISPKVLKSLKGANGKNGADGAAGAQGPQGPAGPAGKDGGPGEKGAPGTNGKSVLAGNEPEGGNCSEGGTSLEVEGSGVKHYACNGKEGPQGIPGTAGPEGVCSTANCHLPSGVTETGVWNLDTLKGVSAQGFLYRAPISFPIPLSVDVAEANILTEPAGFVGKAGEDCPGSAAAPAAKAGHLCIYTTRSVGEWAFEGVEKAASATSTQGASTTGAFIILEALENVSIAGTWAVTGS